MDPEYYHKCETEYQQSCLNREHQNAEREQRWEMLQAAAKAKNPSTNHINDFSPTPEEESSMVIDSGTVNVPERILEESESQQDDIAMAEEALSPSPP